MASLARAYYINEPGVGRVETYPFITERLFKNGFEKVTIRVADAIFGYIARTSHLPHMAKRILSEVYMASPPIDPRDIIAPWIDQEECLVGFSIRRGHFYLSDFFRLHTDPRCTVQGLSCSCHPGEVFPVHLSSFPTYLMREEEAKADV